MHVCVFIYTHNKYTQYTHTYYVHKLFILEAINRDFDSTNIYIYIYIYEWICMIDKDMHFPPQKNKTLMFIYLFILLLYI